VNKILVFLLTVVLSQSSFSASENDLVTLKIKGSVSINLACTTNCGNCCTGQSISNTSTNISIGSSDVELTNYADKSEHWVNGYYYVASGSCNMGTCSLFHISSISKNETIYNSQTGKLSIPAVSVDNKQYKVVLNAPYSIEQAIEIVGQGSDCSQGQQCLEGLTCTTYSGISGAEFKSCEITCIDNKYCPLGKNCINIADGPQNICQ
jgi:hypothetical protein